MTDINSEIINWIELAKGDVVGHEFHGNQWHSEGHADSAIAGHKAGASAMKSLAVKYNGEGRTVAAKSALDAQNAHEEAGKAWQDVKDKSEAVQNAVEIAGATDATPEMKSAYFQAKGDLNDALDRATSATQRAQSLSDGARGFPENPVTQKTTEVDLSGYFKSVEEPEMSDAEITAWVQSAMGETPAPFAKGDTPGHAFHGNQYTSNPFDKGFDSERRFGAGWSALMASAHARDLAQHGATGAQIANAHRAAAFEHGIASKVLKSALAKETNPEKQGALKSAIAAHDQAAELHNWVAEQQESGTDGQIARDNTMLARGASTVATSLSRETGADTGAEFRGPSKRP